MAGTNEIVEIRNETPLDIAVTYMCGHVLKPLETVEFERLPSLVPATFSLPALSGTFLEFQGDALPAVVAIDLATVARRQEHPALNSADEYSNALADLRANGQPVLQVINDTIHVADGSRARRSGQAPTARPSRPWAGSSLSRPRPGSACRRPRSARPTVAPSPAGSDQLWSDPIPQPARGTAASALCVGSERCSKLGSSSQLINRDTHLRESSRG